MNNDNHDKNTQGSPVDNRHSPDQLHHFAQETIMFIQFAQFITYFH